MFTPRTTFWTPVESNIIPHSCMGLALFRRNILFVRFLIAISASTTSIFAFFIILIIIVVVLVAALESIIRTRVLSHIGIEHFLIVRIGDGGYLWKSIFGSGINFHIDLHLFK